MEFLSSDAYLEELRHAKEKENQQSETVSHFHGHFPFF